MRDFSQPLYISNDKTAIVMNHDDEYIKKKFEEFSAVKRCPKCGKLSLVYKNNAIYCESCGYEQKIMG